jgi:hypothetical protein
MIGRIDPVVLTLHSYFLSLPLAASPTALLLSHILLLNSPGLLAIESAPPSFR